MLLRNHDIYNIITLPMYKWRHTVLITVEALPENRYHIEKMPKDAEGSEQALSNMYGEAKRTSKTIMKCFKI